MTEFSAAELCKAVAGLSTFPAVPSSTYTVIANRLVALVPDLTVRSAAEVGRSFTIANESLDVLLPSLSEFLTRELPVTVRPGDVGLRAHISSMKNQDLAYMLCALAPFAHHGPRLFEKGASLLQCQELNSHVRHCGVYLCRLIYTFTQKFTRVRVKLHLLAHRGLCQIATYSTLNMLVPCPHR